DRRDAGSGDVAGAGGRALARLRQDLPARPEGWPRHAARPDAGGTGGGPGVDGTGAGTGRPGRSGSGAPARIVIRTRKRPAVPAVSTGPDGQVTSCWKRRIPN